MAALILDASTTLTPGARGPGPSSEEMTDDSTSARRSRSSEASRNTYSSIQYSVGKALAVAPKTRAR